jgi:hypothetical protein
MAVSIDGAAPPLPKAEVEGTDHLVFVVFSRVHADQGP